MIQTVPKLVNKAVRDLLSSFRVRRQPGQELDEVFLQQVVVVDDTINA
jgi:hypothetical protein